jgi:hypothetical protein
MRSMRLFVVTVLVVVLALTSAQNAFASFLIAYDDGTADSAWGLVAGDMDAVLFSLPSGSSNVGLLTVSAYVYSCAPNNPFPCGGWRVHVTDNNHQELSGSPFDSPVPTQAGWLTIPVPAGIVLPADFYVALEWTLSTGLMIGSDMDTPNTRTYWYQSGSWVHDAGAVMIRAEVDLPSVVVSTTVSTAIIQSTSTVYSTLSTLSTVGTSTHASFTTSITFVGGTVTEYVIEIDSVFAYLLVILRQVVAVPEYRFGLVLLLAPLVAIYALIRRKKTE